MPVLNTPVIESCRFISEGLREVGYCPAGEAVGGSATWRISPRPFALSRADVEWLRQLGPHLQAFNSACNELYLESAVGRQPSWIARLLDQGKPESLVQFAYMRRFRHRLPTVIRPDIIPTSNGMVITELDAVPGGIGNLGRLAELYEALGYELVGDDVTLVRTFGEMISSVATDSPPQLAIVVSDESSAYRAEMTWLAKRSMDSGIQALAVAPNDLWFCEDRVAVKGASAEFNVNVIYRFFELFDLPNIPKIELLMFLNKKNRVAVVPPFRPLFEEKLWFAILHHPILETYWRRMLGENGCRFLSECIPRTWVLDPDPVPAHATVPGLMVSGSAVNAWSQLENLGRGSRQLVLKPSGFSELAWGGRGVVIGHDISTEEWNLELRKAVDSFARTPHVLQEFRNGRQFDGEFYDPTTESIRTVRCRVRLCPYYFVVGSEVRLASVMATMCPLEKKKIHGMPEAIIVPCTVE